MAFPLELVGAGFAGAQAVGLGGNGGTVAATGSTQTDAAPVSTQASLQIVTAADGTKGVLLPSVEEGSECTLFNNTSSTLKVYPPLGGAIAVNGTGLGTLNAAFSHLTFKTVCYKYQSTTQIFPNVSS